MTPDKKCCSNCTGDAEFPDTCTDPTCFCHRLNLPREETPTPPQAEWDGQKIRDELSRLFPIITDENILARRDRMTDWIVSLLSEQKKKDAEIVRKYMIHDMRCDYSAKPCNCRKAEAIKQILG